MGARSGEPSGRCAVCKHPERYRVELALVGGASHRVIGQNYGLNKHALWRHLRKHVSKERRAQLVAGPLKLSELSQKAAEEGLALLDYLQIIRSTLLSQFMTTSEAGDSNGAATVAGRLLECLRIIATLTGEISRTSAVVTNNIAILQSPLMADLQGMLIRTLQPFPEARAAVLGGLEQLSARAMSQAAPTTPTTLLLEQTNG
jgi:hypothetical protein